MRDLAASHREKDEAVAAERGKVDDARRAVEKAQADLAAVEERLRTAESSGSADLKRLVAERDEARTKLEEAKAKADEQKVKLAALADKLGEVEGERDKLKKHADELDSLMKTLADKGINVRRLAGLEAPPNVDVEVVSVDDRRTPPVLILRAESLDGFEEGDKLYVVRTGDGKRREAGRVLVDKVDRARGLLSGTVSKLSAGEKISVGEKLTTAPP
jgi:predicted RNase H-like nuclease (RuvC/YqgF family)